MKRKLISVVALALAVVVGTSAMAMDFSSYECCDDHYNDHYYAQHTCCVDYENKELLELEGVFKYIVLGYSVRATAYLEEVYLIFPNGDEANIQDIVLSAGQTELVELFWSITINAPYEGISASSISSSIWPTCCGRTMVWSRLVGVSDPITHIFLFDFLTFTCTVVVHAYRDEIIERCTGRFIEVDGHRMVNNHNNVLCPDR